MAHADESKVAAEVEAESGPRRRSGAPIVWHVCNDCQKRVPGGQFLQRKTGGGLCRACSADPNLKAARLAAGRGPGKRAKKPNVPVKLPHVMSFAVKNSPANPNRIRTLGWDSLSPDDPTVISGRQAAAAAEARQREAVSARIAIGVSPFDTRSIEKLVASPAAIRYQSRLEELKMARKNIDDQIEATKAARGSKRTATTDRRDEKSRVEMYAAAKTTFIDGFKAVMAPFLQPKCSCCGLNPFQTRDGFGEDPIGGLPFCGLCGFYVCAVGSCTYHSGKKEFYPHLAHNLVPPLPEMYKHPMPSLEEINAKLAALREKIRLDREANGVSPCPY